MKYANARPRPSYHITTPSLSTKIRDTTDTAYMKQSRLTGHQSSCTTWPANKPQHAGTARTLNTAEPTTVPTPMSLCVINVPTELMNNSGLDVAAAMNVAPTTSSFMLNATE